MTDRPMKMSREQFEALFAAVELAGATAGLAAKNHARRLLVEPEQGDESSYYIGDDGEWHKISARPDPDLTTFGELEAGEWFKLEVSQNIGVKATDLVRERYGVNAFSACGSVFSTLSSSTPVRRLPNPEFKS